ncbi:ATP-binding cassette domain-containing protein, partial [Pseudomonas aeruginosa]|nr:ATP-binding cassette domain-containing protein [Pseudomonas aeruginosa]
MHWGTDSDNTCFRFHFFATDGTRGSSVMTQPIFLIGPRGCGKTTVGRTLLGLYEKNAGSVKFHGQELADLTAPALRA